MASGGLNNRQMDVVCVKILRTKALSKFPLDPVEKPAVQMRLSTFKRKTEDVCLGQLFPLLAFAPSSAPHHIDRFC